MVRVFEKAYLSIKKDEAEKSLKNLRVENPVGLNGVANEYLRLTGNVCGQWLVRMFKVCLNARRVLMD